MRIFLVAAVLSLTILAPAWGAPGQHYLIKTKDGGDNNALPLDGGDNNALPLDGEDNNDGGGDYYCESFEEGPI